MFSFYDSLEVFMKKSVILSLLFLSLNGLYAMEAVESEPDKIIERIPVGALPQEWLCQIARHKLSDEMPIALEDAVQDIAEYAHGAVVSSVAVFPDGRRVVSAARDGRVKIADANTGEVLAEYKHGGNGTRVFYGSNLEYADLVGVFPDGTRVLSSGHNNMVKVADANTGEVLAEYAHRDVDSVDVSSDGTRVFSGGDEKVKIFDVTTGNLTEYEHDDFVSSVGVFPDGARVLYCRESVYPVCVFPDGRLVLSDGWAGLRITDAHTGEVLAEDKSGDSVISVGVFPDGRRVLSGGLDKKVKIKNIAPLLLATHQPKDPTLSQYLLLKRLQEKLLKAKEPLVIGQSDRTALEGMPDLKKLLKVEKSKSKTTNPIWRLQLRRGADAAEPEPAAGWPNICSVV